MAKQGYARGTMSKVRNILNWAVDLGIEEEIWTSGKNPMRDVKIPASLANSDDSRPDRGLIPTVEQVKALQEIAFEINEQWGLMVTIAAYTGIRWGELMALTVGKIDLGGKVMRVDLTCVEDIHGHFHFRKQMKGGGRATRVASDRKVAVGPEVLPALTRYLGTLEEHPNSDLIVSDTPVGRLFAREDGAPHRRGEQSKLLREMTAKVSAVGGPWPVGATWHYLRHFCATYWLRDQKMDAETVSTMIGHENLSTTMDWYVNTDQETINRAIETLYRSEEA